MASLLDRHEEKIKGILSCYDRVIIHGTLPEICYAAGMTRYLNTQGVRIFDYAKWAERLRDRIRTNAEAIAAAHGLTIEYLRKPKGVRKEQRVQAIIKERGAHPGLVHVFSVLEMCTSYKPWHNKQTGQTYLVNDSGKCLHYYFYFIDPELGLCYLRVPTWCPFRLQFYFNGHNLLAAQLTKHRVAFTLSDNAFLDIADFGRAQQIADALHVATLHRALDRFARQYCPVLKRLGVRYHWSLMQVEYATDIVFKQPNMLADLYHTLVRTSIHAVKADHVATFLGRKLDARFQGELGTDFTTQILGTRIKHHMGPAAIKMYDKFGCLLRIETTINDVGFFRHHRTVEQKDGRKVMKLASVRKTIYSLAPDLRALMLAANLRYLAFLSDLEDPTAGIRDLRKTCAPARENDRTYKGFNFFSGEDQDLFEHLVRGEHLLNAIRNKHLRTLMKKTSAQVSQVLKRLRLHGLIKKIARSYKYYLTDLGRRIATTGLKLKHLFIIPALAAKPVS